MPALASRLAGALSVVVVILPLGACTSSQLGAHGPSDPPAPGGALVTVENQHAQDMRVYLRRGDTPILLGSVTTLERRTFVIPTSMLGQSGTVQLLVHPIGSTQSFFSPLIQAAPGDLVEWHLAPRLNLSSYNVRRLVG